MDILKNERSGQLQQPDSIMSKSPTATLHEPPCTTLGKDTEFQGTLKFSKALKIEGKFDGSITSEGSLIIGETGCVTAEIEVGSLIIEGHLTGNVTAIDLVELRKSAELRGDITASKLKIDEGVTFVGQSDVQPKSSRAASTPANQQSSKDLKKGENSQSKKGHGNR